MRVTDWRSPFSGRRAEHGHHMSATDAAGSYLDPRLIMPITRVEHVRTHQSWPDAYREGADGEPLLLRLRRIANELVRLGEHHADGVVTLPAVTVLELGRTLFDIAMQVEVRWLN
jgi:hypothetical protein